MYEALSQTKAAFYHKLNQRKWRQQERLFLVEGTKIIEDVLDRFGLEVLIVPRKLTTRTKQLLTRVEERNVREASPALFQKLTSLSSVPDCVAVFRLPDEAYNQAVPPCLKKDQIYLLLDGIQDPGNLGTILRTCWWFGVKEIFASVGTVDLYSPKSIQSTKGALGNVNVAYTDLVQLIEKNPGIPVFGTFMQGENIFGCRVPQGAMIIMGNEGHGITPSLERKVTDRITIPPYASDHPESLNVAIATAIVFAQFRR